MWRRILPIVFVLSVAVNLAVVGTWLVSAAAGGWARPAPQPDGGPSDCPMHQRLGTTQEQWQKIEPLRSRFRQVTRDLSEQARQAREELIDLLEAPQADRQAIADKQSQILAVQGRMQQAVIEYLLAQKEHLTPEQQMEFFSAIRQRGGWGPGPGMGRGKRMRRGEGGAGRGQGGPGRGRGRQQPAGEAQP